MPYDVFISYSHHNQEVADAIYSALKAKNIKVWMAPNDIPANENYDNTLINVLPKIRVFIIIVSKDSIGSGFVRSELAQAFSNKSLIIPFRLDDEPVEGSMRLYLNQAQWIQATENSENSYNALIDRVMNALGSETSTQTSSQPNASQQIETQNSCVGLGICGKRFGGFNKPSLVIVVICVAIIGLLFGLRKESSFSQDTPNQTQTLGQPTQAVAEMVDKGSLRDKFGGFEVVVNREAAEQGAANAQFFLGLRYYLGDGVEKNLVEAVKWYAQQGSASAQFNLGLRYYLGDGVEKNLVEAVKWYRKAAQQGDVDAQFNLGVCYNNGYGVEKNLAEAVSYFQKAAEQGNAKAQFILGSSYEIGYGVNINYSEAVKWYSKAAGQGHYGSEMALKRLGTK